MIISAIALGPKNVLAQGVIPPAITTPDKVETAIGTLEFRGGAPSAATLQKGLVHAPASLQPARVVLRQNLAPH